ncbi:MAG: hypothetical protein IJT96_05290 [Lachnospiraceae bacterium]|nr:hypothetical protein [Lachnospiraceae bacterium]
MVSGIKASDKTYDGSVTADIDTSGASFDGIIESDNGRLSVTATGTFSDANAGDGKTVTLSGITLHVEGTADYVLAEPPGEHDLPSGSVASFIEVLGICGSIYLWYCA